MMARKRREVIIPEKVVDADPQQLRDETDMVPMVKIVEKVDTFAEERVDKKPKKKR